MTLQPDPRTTMSCSSVTGTIWRGCGSPRRRRCRSARSGWPWWASTEKATSPIALVVVSSGAFGRVAWIAAGQGGQAVEPVRPEDHGLHNRNLSASRWLPAAGEVV